MNFKTGMRMSAGNLCGVMLAGAGILACGGCLTVLQQSLTWNIWLLFLLLIG
jgi:hypothetical protein